MRRLSRSDRGAAVVDFVLIAALLVILLFAVLQVAVYFYARNIVAASAADGARYAGNAGVDPAAGAVRARQMIETGLNVSAATAIPCSGAVATDGPSGLPVARVHCHGRLAVVFLPLTIDVTASSLKEAAP